MQLFRFLLLVALPSLTDAYYDEEPFLNRRMIRTGAAKFQALGKAVGKTATTYGRPSLDPNKKTFHDIAFSTKGAEKYMKGKADVNKAADAAKEFVQHQEKTNGWDPKASYSLRSGIHGPDPQRPHQAGYFPNDPSQKWTNLQRQDPNDPKKTESIHIPTDKNDKFDPKVAPYIAGPNKNSGKTAVPGKGSATALGNGAIPLPRRSVETLIEILRRDLEERDFNEDLWERELEDRDIYDDLWERDVDDEFDLLW